MDREHSSNIVKPVSFAELVQVMITLEKHWFKIAELPLEKG